MSKRTSCYKFEKFEQLMISMCQELVKVKKTKKEEGSINYLLKVKSNQSILIRVGNEFEKLIREFSAYCENPHHELSGKKLQKIQIDYLTEIGDILLYRELKGYAGLDSEKLPKTVDKILQVKKLLSEQYSEVKEVKCGFFHFTAWDESSSSNEHKHTYDLMRKNGIDIIFMSDYFSELGVSCTKQQWEEVWLNCSKIINQNN